MNRYDQLMTAIRGGEPTLIDGATGSECLRRGAPQLTNGWSGGVALSNPEILLQVHAEYLELGARLIATNTFATGRNVLRDAGVEGDFEALNRRAVEVAVEARNRATWPASDAVVAGGISNWSFSGDHPSLDELHQNTVEQATIMRDGGVDLISLEMMVDLPRFSATLDAVASVDLPIWVGFSIGPESGHSADELRHPIELREGGLLDDAVGHARTCDRVDVVCLMHSDVRLTEPGVAALRSHWDGPIAAYAHAAQSHDDEIHFDDTITPDDYASYAAPWRDAGATILGGCCGIGPSHIRALADVLGE